MRMRRPVKYAALAVVLMASGCSSGAGEQSSPTTARANPLAVAPRETVAATRRAEQERAERVCQRGGTGIGKVFSSAPTNVGVARGYETRALNSYVLAHAFAGAPATAFAAWCFARWPVLGPDGYRFYVVGPRDEVHLLEALTSRYPPRPPSLRK